MTNLAAQTAIFSLDAWSTNSKDLNNQVSLTICAFKADVEQTDVAYQLEAAQFSKTYMMPISGSFFSHSSASNLVYRTENWALADRWEQAIALQPDYIEVMSW